MLWDKDNNSEFAYTLVIYGLLFLAIAPAVHAADLVNPLGQTYTIPQIIGNLIKAALSIIGSITLIVFIYGGTLWLTSAGYEERIKQGKQTMIWAILGLIMLFASYVLVNRLFVAITPPDAALEYSEEELFGGPAGRSACATWGGSCVTLSSCPGPASIDQCMRDYQLEQDRAHGGTSRTTCAYRDAGQILCTGTLQVCCKTEISNIPNPDLVCAKENEDTYCRPCIIPKCPDGTMSPNCAMDGFCNRQKRCQEGAPKLLEDPLCVF